MQHVACLVVLRDSSSIKIDRVEIAFFFQAPGVVGSVLGLVGPVSVYCDWVR